MGSFCGNGLRGEKMKDFLILRILPQQLLEMFTFCPHTRAKTLTPLINCTVNDAVVHVVPNLQQALLIQIVYVVHL